jgi:hypothetical protein
MSLYRSIADALLVFIDKIVAYYERRLQEKESEMQDKIRKLDEVQASAAELLHRYNQLVKENADNKAALDELTSLFDKEIDETVSAMTENTKVEEPEDPEFEPSGNEPIDPSGNTPANPTGGSRTGGSRSGSGGGPKASGKPASKGKK